MQNKDFEQTLALAGVCQAAELVREIARTGHSDENALLVCIRSIIMTDPENTLAVYGDLNGLKIGLQTLRKQLGNQSASKDAEITRYIASLLGLERKLSRNRGKMSELAERISHSQRQQQHMELMEAQSIANLASIYRDVISPVGPKIQVAGTPSLLKMPLVQNKVRALLLAGLRSAVLWRQLGGTRRQILFNRKKSLSNAEHALQLINHSN